MVLLFLNSYVRTHRLFEVGCHFLKIINSIFIIIRLIFLITIIMFDKNLVWGKLDWKVRRQPPWLDRNPIDPPMIIVIVTSSSSPSSRSLIITLINIITPSIIINVKYHKIFTGMTVSQVQNKTILMYFHFSLTSLSLYCYIGQMFLCLVDSYPHKEISNICFVWYFSNHFFHQVVSQ